MDANYLLLGKQPISEAQPAGNEVRAEPAFERLQAELDKLSSPSLAAQVDWAQVESAAAELLQHSGKDVLVACYLCYALTLRHGLKGLETGLVILADMHSSYWESMHPKLARMRARRNAVEWLLEKCLGLFEQDGPLVSQTYSPALIASIQEQISRLDTVLDAHMPDAPSFSSFAIWSRPCAWRRRFSLSPRWSWRRTWRWRCQLRPLLRMHSHQSIPPLQGMRAPR